MLWYRINALPKKQPQNVKSNIENSSRQAACVALRLNKTNKNSLNYNLPTLV